MLGRTEAVVVTLRRKAADGADGASFASTGKGGDIKLLLIGRTSSRRQVAPLRAAQA